MTHEEEKIFSSVEPIVKKIKDLARSLSTEVAGGDLIRGGPTEEERYSEILQAYVNSGKN